jgi:integrase/recombinase XerD
MGVQLDRNPCSRSPESVFMMAGIGVHHARNRCSASVGIGVHVRPESAFTMGRNLQLAVPSPATWIGRRDRTLLTVLIETGLRVSELIRLWRADVVVGRGAHVRCEGKGRKQRCTPLGRNTAALVDTWLRADLKPESAWVFPSRRGGPLSRDAIEELATRYAHVAQQRCPSLKEKRVTPHVLRHSAAMRLLAHGVDRSVIALWLGHESLDTTQMYLHADLRLKERALACVEPLGVIPARYRPDDTLLSFLESL